MARPAPRGSFRGNAAPSCRRSIEERRREVKDHWKDIRAGLGDLLRRLSGAQKVSLGLIAATLVTGVVLLAASGDDLDSGVRLAAAGTPGTAAAGTEVVSWTWLFAEGGGILERPERFQAKFLESHCRSIEDSIRWNAKIQRANIVIRDDRSSLFAREDRQSAMVALFLNAGVPSLPRAEANAIRTMVAGAFNLSADKVSLVDNLGNSYSSGDGTSGESLEVSERAESLRSRVHEGVSALCRLMFLPEDFAVVVSVRLSSRRSSVEELAFDPEGTVAEPVSTELKRQTPAGGLLVPPEEGVETIVEERTRNLVLPAGTRRRTEIPAGEVQAISVSVLLDLEAVTRVEGDEARAGLHRGDGDTRDPVARQKHVIENYLAPYENAHVMVVAQPFARGLPATAQHAGGLAAAGEKARGAGPGRAESGGAAAAGDAAPVPAAAPAAAPESQREGVGDLWRPFAAAAAVLFVLLLAVLLVKGTTHHLRRAALRRAAEDDDLGRLDAPLSVGEGGDEPDDAASFERTAGGVGLKRMPGGALGGIENVTRSVRERPDAAAAVVRLWLAQDTDWAKEAERC